MSLFRRTIKESGTFRTTKTINNRTGKTSTSTIRVKTPVKTAVTTATRKAKRSKK
jgi:hypothetical protein